MIWYLIKNSKDEYSRGGYNPTFTKKRYLGKIWNGMGAVKNHLNQVLEHQKYIPEDWEIVAISIVADESINAKTFYEKDFFDKKEKQRTVNEESKKDYIKNQIKRLEDQLKTIK